MINRIIFNHYRRLKAPLELSFHQNINVLSGMNGTCKSSILYLISNAFKAENTKTTLLSPKSQLLIINKISAQINPKIELLTKGDRKYNNPAPNHSGALFKIEYDKNIKIEFRRHNSTEHAKSRFRLIPSHATKGEGLPTLRTVYLSLTRLVPFGELSDDTPQKKVHKELPNEYNDIFHTLVNEIAGIKIQESKSQIIENIKTRTEYNTNQDGIDSNTASAGEDNIIVILKNLVLLRYYYEHSPNYHTDNYRTASILLIDELDATLHPAMQLRLLNVLIQYSEAYKIQVFFTTHSLYLLNKLLSGSYKKYVKVNYLTHQGDHITLLPEPSIQKIERHLQEIQQRSYSYIAKIPIFTEDEEARVILNSIFGYFATHCKYFNQLRTHFHFVEASIGCNVLKQIFQDTYLDTNTMNSICILDGDNTGQKQTKRNIIVLPGSKSPEKMIFDYCEDLSNGREFWDSNPALSSGFTKQRYTNEIQPHILDIQTQLNTTKNEGGSTKGMERTLNKELFKQHREEFTLILDYWLDNHYNELEQFYRDLRFCFRQVALLHKLDPESWPQEAKLQTQRI
ncbi:ATP-dependent nuclease [Neisseria montereyensis]|uniref:AAA family ATPase n=1 Tax=Neisseria montereyensis TaxID=2973938 RepID=A0ABT2FDW9_9NEIS|nr:AAA family ATPase [Neisseria montereyensis]MCS4534338.1 AAA family ATPase [Neisseria montereyensis]